VLGRHSRPSARIAAAAPVEEGRKRTYGTGLHTPQDESIQGQKAAGQHRVVVMAKPVLVVVDDEDTSLQALTRELRSRYGAHYQVVSSSSAEMALARLAELKAAGADVPLVLADQQMPGMGGTQLLAQVRQFFPKPSWYQPPACSS
jgi:PleD family two-component response regulator